MYAITRKINRNAITRTFGVDHRGDHARAAGGHRCGHRKVASAEVGRVSHRCADRGQAGLLARLVGKSLKPRNYTSGAASLATHPRVNYPRRALTN